MSLLFPCISFIVLLCVFFGLLFLILSFVVVLVFFSYVWFVFYVFPWDVIVCCWFFFYLCFPYLIFRFAFLCFLSFCHCILCRFFLSVILFFYEYSYKCLRLWELLYVTQMGNPSHLSLTQNANHSDQLEKVNLKPNAKGYPLILKPVPKWETLNS